MPARIGHTREKKLGSPSAVNITIRSLWSVAHAEPELTWRDRKDLHLKPTPAWSKHQSLRLNNKVVAFVWQPRWANPNIIFLTVNSCLRLQIYNHCCSTSTYKNYFSIYRRTRKQRSIVRDDPTRCSTAFSQRIPLHQGQEARRHFVLGLQPIESVEVSLPIGTICSSSTTNDFFL